MAKGKPTISYIALKSGVSISTVSLVLNNKPGISEETRARVLEIAGELEYPLKPSAEWKSSSLTTIGMVIKTDPDISPQANPFYSKVIMGIEDMCRRNTINLLFATLPVDENNHPMEIPQLIYNDTVDGLLMVGICVDESFKSISDKRMIPVVLVDGYSNTNSFDSVVSDNFQAAYKAVEYLIQKGHRHIGLVDSENKCYPSLKERRNGYLRALKENGVGNNYITNFNINKSHGYQETLSLLKEYPHLTALFCVNASPRISRLSATMIPTLLNLRVLL
jgi:LacI family transcriptional regulator